MRDIKLFVDEDSNLVDVDVVNGEPVLLDFAEQTGDQRAAVACFISKGTLPGNLDFGISWGQMYTNDSTLIDFSNKLRKFELDIAFMLFRKVDLEIVSSTQEYYISISKYVFQNSRLNSQ